MKDLSMTERNERFLKAKSALDRAIQIVAALADEAEAESIACCRSDDLDERDKFGAIAGHLNTARGSLWLARAEAGSITGGGIARSGGT